MKSLPSCTEPVTALGSLHVELCPSLWFSFSSEGNSVQIFCSSFSSLFCFVETEQERCIQIVLSWLVLFVSFQHDQQVVAIRALEHLSEHSQDCRQVFAALKWGCEIFTWEGNSGFFPTEVILLRKVESRADEGLVSSAFHNGDVPQAQTPTVCIHFRLFPGKLWVYDFIVIWTNDQQQLDWDCSNSCGENTSSAVSCDEVMSCWNVLSLIKTNTARKTSSFCFLFETFLKVHLFTFYYLI